MTMIDVNSIDGAQVTALLVAGNKVTFKWYGGDYSALCWLKSLVGHRDIEMQHEHKAGNKFIACTAWLKS